MRVVGARAKAQPLVEACRLGIGGAQAQALEPAARRLDDRFNQLLTDSQPPIRRQHVEVAHPADVRLGGVRIHVEAADADDVLAAAGREERLAGPVEAIRAAGPLISQPSNEAQAASLALGDQRRQAFGLQGAEAFDGHRPATILAPGAISRGAGPASGRRGQRLQLRQATASRVQEPPPSSRH
jgi:hypothetical protein